MSTKRIFEPFEPVNDTTYPFKISLTNLEGLTFFKVEPLSILYDLYKDSNIFIKNINYYFPYNSNQFYFIYLECKISNNISISNAKIVVSSEDLPESEFNNLFGVNRKKLIVRKLIATYNNFSQKIEQIIYYNLITKIVDFNPSEAQTISIEPMYI